MDTSFPAACEGMNDSWLAMSRFRRRHYASSIDLCTQELKTAPRDELSWFLKARAMTQLVYIDDTEESFDQDEDSVLDTEGLVVGTKAGNISKLGLKSRIGTARGTARRSKLGSSYARTGSKRHLQSSRVGSRIGSQMGGKNNHSMSVGGRFLRPGTAALLTGSDGMFIDVSSLRPASFSDKPALARVLVDYLLFHELNPKAAQRVLTLLHDASRGTDYWVKARLAKCYQWLGLQREADLMYSSVKKNVDWPYLYLEHSLVLLRLGQPKRCLEQLVQAMTVASLHGEKTFYTSQGRLYQLLNDDENSIAMHKQRLVKEPIHIESLASLAAYCYYEGNAERALRFYQRIANISYYTPALLNNLAMSAYQAGQHDVAQQWLRQAQQNADDTDAADIFYNIGCLGVFVGDELLTNQGFRNCQSLNPKHSEAQNNMGMQELKNNTKQQFTSYTHAKTWFESAVEADPMNIDALINLAITYKYLGILEKAYECATKAQALEPELSDARQLVTSLENIFTNK